MKASASPAIIACRQRQQRRQRQREAGNRQVGFVPAFIGQPAKKQLHRRLASDQYSGQQADFGAGQLEALIAEDDEKADAHRAQAADGINSAENA